MYMFSDLVDSLLTLVRQTPNVQSLPCPKLLSCTKYIGVHNLGVSGDL